MKTGVGVGEDAGAARHDNSELVRTLIAEPLSEANLGLEATGAVDVKTHQTRSLDPNE